MLNENNIITPELKQSVIEILSLILNKNSFAFNNEPFLQIHGTAMGSSMAPTYANIFTHDNIGMEASQRSNTGSYTN
jgi:hypothetical protein